MQYPGYYWQVQGDTTSPHCACQSSGAFSTLPTAHDSMSAPQSSSSQPALHGHEPCWTKPTHWTMSRPISACSHPQGYVQCPGLGWALAARPYQYGPQHVARWTVSMGPWLELDSRFSSNQIPSPLWCIFTGSGTAWLRNIFNLIPCFPFILLRKV